MTSMLARKRAYHGSLACILGDDVHHDIKYQRSPSPAAEKALVWPQPKARFQQAYPCAARVEFNFTCSLCDVRAEL